MAGSMHVVKYPHSSNRCEARADGQPKTASYIQSCLHKLGVHVLGVLLARALLFWGYITGLLLRNV